jgi:tetratricopeptide (TPR) repeat protein
MKTLYDLLGALPDDDADSLRAAFRKAAKANHPDFNPGNAEASEKFRRIVRANAILSDEQQRSAYDRMLKVARQQQSRKPKRSIFSNTIHRLAADAMVSAVVSVVLIGGYLLFISVDKLPLASAQMTKVSTRALTATAILNPTAISDAQGRAEQHDKPELVGADMKLEVNPLDVKAPTNPNGIAPAVTTSVAPEVTTSLAPELTTSVAPVTTSVAPVTTSVAPVTTGVAPEVTTGIAPASAPASPARGAVTKDAKYYRERGTSAYSSGDLYIALVNFDLAIELDPGLSDSYIDRAIVFHRLGDLKRAFADVAEAKRIDALNRKKTPSVASAP